MAATEILQSPLAAELIGGLLCGRLDAEGVRRAASCAPAQNPGVAAEGGSALSC